MLILITVIAGAVGSVYFLFFSGYLEITAFQVNAADEILREKVEETISDWLNVKYLGIAGRKNTLFLPADKLIGNLLETFPEIGHAEISKDYPHSLTVLIKTRQPEGIWCLAAEEPERCFYFDREGITYAQTTPSTGFLVFNISDFRKRELALGQPVVSREWLEPIFTARDRLRQRGVRVSRFIIPADSFDEFQVETGESWKILFSIKTDVARQAASLVLFLEKQKETARVAPLEYIDLRIQDRIYYK